MAKGIFRSIGLEEIKSGHTRKHGQERRSEVCAQLKRKVDNFRVKTPRSKAAISLYMGTLQGRHGLLLERWDYLALLATGTLAEGGSRMWV